MAVCEQLIFGFRRDGAPGRDVLACSVGIEGTCAREIVGLCEAWGRVPAEGLRRAVVLSSPLESRLTSLSGRLRAVIRIGTGLKPLFHAVVLDEAGAAEFAGDPFAVARGEVFVDMVVPGQVLSRRELAQPAAAFAGLATGPDDLGFVDEALRQMLVNRRLTLPLETGSDESDRFLELVVLALPGFLRRELTLASWTPGDGTRYQLAAVARDAAFYRTWRPYLMALPMGKLDGGAEAYVAQVRERIAAGDVAGLAQLSDAAVVDVGPRSVRPRAARPGTLAATVPVPPEPPRPRPAPRRTAPERPVPVREQAPRREPVRRPAPRPGTSAIARRCALVVMVGLLALGLHRGAGKGAWWGRGDDGVRLHANPNFGIVDVGRLHRDALAAEDPHHTQQVLQQAAQLLDTQAQAYLEQVAATFATGGRDDAHAAAQPLPPLMLAEKGERLAEELRRLILADVSLVEGPRWRDLSRLEGRRLTARCDSLLAARGGVPPNSIAAAAHERLAGVTAARRRAIALDRVQGLLAERAWRPGWERDLAEAARGLDGGPGGGAVRWARAAHALARLKEAEQATDFGAAALTFDDPTASWRTGPVAAALPDLKRAVAAFGSRPPSLPAATARFYDDLAQGWSATEGTPPDQLAAVLRGLADNRAVAFDPAGYGDHVHRLAVAVVQSLRARGIAADAMPEAVFPGGRREETIAFLAAAAQGRDGAGWQAEAARFVEPFFGRWAARLARQAAATRAARDAAFAASYDRLARSTRELSRAIARRDDPAARYREVRALAEAALRDHPDGFAGQPDLARRWRRVEALRAALAAPLPVTLATVTVRLASAPAAGTAVLVQLESSGRRLVSAPIALSPAAPAGSGWVGAAPVNWRIAPAAGERIAARVLAVPGGGELLRVDYEPWLDGADPAALARFAEGDDGRLAWTLADDGWSRLRLPDLD